MAAPAERSATHLRRARRRGERAAERRPAKDIAYEHVKARIVAMASETGEFLREEDVAEATGISRTPVREAFLRLEAEGLLRLVPKKGAFIPPISSREMEELMAARVLLERHAMAAAIRHPQAVAEALEAVVQTQEQALAGGDYRRFIEVDADFHVAAVQAGGNSVITAIYRSLRTRQLRLGTSVASVASAARFERALAEHRAIVQALRSGDLEAALAAIEAHSAATLAAARGRPELWSGGRGPLLT